MNAERRPQFFLVGAPKSGTTAMYEYLRMHPALFLPARKELRYFGSDLEILDRQPLRPADYLAYFESAPPDALIGTAYVWYLFSRKAAAEIASFSPDARIIAMLRDPVEMLPALHSEHLSNGNEDIADFGDALRAEPDRRAGRRIPAHAHLPQGLLYSEVPRYSEQLDRYFEVFGRDRVHVVIFDDFRADTAESYASVLRFLGVDDDFRPPSFAPLNTNKRIRSERLRHFLARPPDVIRRAIRYLVPTVVRRNLYERAKAANMKQARRPPVSEETIEKLRATFRDEVGRLSRLLDRDLGQWASIGRERDDAPAPHGGRETASER